MSGLRIDFVTPPFAGHLYPLLQLAQQLRIRGYSELRFCSTPESHDAVKLSDFAFVPCLRDSSHVVMQIANTRTRVGSHPVRLWRQLQMNLSLMNQFREELRQLWSKHPPDLVIADMTVPAAGLLAQSLGIPWWTFTPTPSVVETPDGTPAYLGGWMPTTHPFGRIRDAAGRQLVRTFKQTLHRLFRRPLQQLGIPRIYRDDGYETVYSSNTILAVGVREFEFPGSWPPWMQFIGPLCKSPPLEHQPPVFIDNRPHVLISLGTHLWWAKDHVRNLMRQVASAMPNHVFHFTYGRPASTSYLVEQNFHTCDYLPYDQYLHRYQAAVIHGGTGVLYSCLSHGVPMLVWPQDYDQFDHAARVTYHGLGLRCQPNVPAIIRDLHRLTSDSRVLSNLRRMQNTIRSYDAGSIVAQRLESLTSGSSAPLSQ